MAKKKCKKIEEKVATSFVVEIIEEAMKKFNLTYDELNRVLKRMNYWELFNNSEITTVGAHYGVEYVLDKIEEELRKNEIGLLKYRNLNYQSELIIKKLMKNGMTREQAFNTWYKSKTKSVLEKQRMFWVAGTRCYVELEYELTGNPKWMKEPFG